MKVEIYKMKLKCRKCGHKHQLPNKCLQILGGTATMPHTCACEDK